MTLAAMLLLVLLGLYGVGVRRLWKRSPATRSLMPIHVASFTIGWLALQAAFSGYIDAPAHERFAVHMVQHELLVALAAPMLAMARIGVAIPHALPKCVLASLQTAVARRLRSAVRGTAALGAALIVHSAVLWAWHLPPLHAAALESAPLHDLQHITMLGTGVIFWAAAVRAAGASRGDLAAVLAAFLMVFHTGVLGALLTLSPAPMYAGYSATLSATAAIADQQLGGLVMWVAGCAAYVAFGLVVTNSLLTGTRPRRTSTAPLEKGITS